jgi:hypothetical protein
LWKTFQRGGRVVVYAVTAVVAVVVEDITEVLAVVV